MIDPLMLIFAIPAVFLFGSVFTIVLLRAKKHKQILHEIAESLDFEFSKEKAFFKVFFEKETGSFISKLYKHYKKMISLPGSFVTGFYNGFEITIDNYIERFHRLTATVTRIRLKNKHKLPEMLIRPASIFGSKDKISITKEFDKFKTVIGKDEKKIKKMINKDLQNELRSIKCTIEITKDAITYEEPRLVDDKEHLLKVIKLLTKLAKN